MIRNTKRMMSAMLVIGLMVSVIQAQSPSCSRLAGYCVIPIEWTETAFQERLAQANGDFIWQDDDQLTFAFNAPNDTSIDAVRMIGTLSESLTQVETSPWWTITLQMADLDQAVLTYYFMPSNNGRVVNQGNFSPQIWRGADAPARVRLIEAEIPLAGTMRYFALESESLQGSRQIDVYLPPQHDPTQSYPVIYLTDGNNAESFARVLEPWILDGVLSPMILVGVHNQGTSQGRSAEYLLGNRAIFTAHETFFTIEVREWAEALFGASTQREERGIFGFSNGGAFAALMALNHPDLYGHSFPFSIAGSNSWFRVNPEATEQAKFYFVAGSLERPFYEGATQISRYLEAEGLTVKFQPRVSGHDFVMWVEEFPRAVLWSFADQDYEALIQALSD